MQIEDLTNQQAKLLDKIWCTKKESDLTAWVATLPHQQRDEVIILVELVILEHIESHVNNMDGKYPEVFNMIMKCK